MNWREPWGASKNHQAGMFALAILLGLLLALPVWVESWNRWRSVNAAADRLQDQQALTASLRDQTTQLLSSTPTTNFTWVDVQMLSALASSHALEFLRSSQEAQSTKAHLEGLQIQLVPLQFEVQGTWSDWLVWLEQWPTAALGVTLSSLTLRATPNGSLLMQMGASAVRPRDQNAARSSELSGDEQTQTGGDLFDVAHWAHTKQRHAQSHPSYARNVAPELQRAQEPLEQYPREYLHYVGQISTGADVQALIRVHDPAATQFAEVHRVRVGSHAGQHFGRVLRIDQDHLLLDELRLVANGEWQRQEVRIALQERKP